MDLRALEFRSLALDDMVVRLTNMPNVTVSSIVHGSRLGRRDEQTIILGLSGDANNIQALYRNRNNFRARVWFTNLQSGTNPSVPSSGAVTDATPSAEVLGIAIVPVGR